MPSSSYYLQVPCSNIHRIAPLYLLPTIPLTEPILPVGIALISVLSAIGVCERCRVESGGVYFLLSHVLGPRSAAAVGVLYVFGQVSHSFRVYLKAF